MTSKITDRALNFILLNFEAIIVGAVALAAAVSVGLSIWR